MNISQKKADIDNRVKSAIDLLNITLEVDKPGMLTLSEHDKKNIQSVGEMIKFLLVRATLLIDEIAQSHTNSICMIQVGLNDLTVTDEERIALLNNLVTNMKEFLPAEWKEYFNLKHERLQTTFYKKNEQK